MVYINVVNRHQSKSITADLTAISHNFTGQADASIINSDDLKAPFTIDKQSQYAPTASTVKLSGNRLQYAFLPHSFTQIKVAIK